MEAETNPVGETPEQALEELLAYIEGELDSESISGQIAYGELTLKTGRDKVIDVIRFLHDDSRTRFISIIDICGVDFPEREERFDIVYHLMSPQQNARVRVIISAGEGTPVTSLTGVFPGADWFEREVYDMYGVRFSGHPDLRRLLTDYGFDGYPLRKDFPLTGYVEVRYDEVQKRVVYEPVELRQEFRNFDFSSPWEGPDYILPGDEKADTVQ